MARHAGGRAAGPGASAQLSPAWRRTSVSEVVRSVIEGHRAKLEKEAKE